MTKTYIMLLIPCWLHNFLVWSFYEVHYDVANLYRGKSLLNLFLGLFEFFLSTGCKNDVEALLSKRQSKSLTNASIKIHKIPSDDPVISTHLFDPYFSLRFIRFLMSLTYAKWTSRQTSANTVQAPKNNASHQITLMFSLKNRDIDIKQSIFFNKNLKDIILCETKLNRLDNYWLFCIKKQRRFLNALSLYLKSSTKFICW